MELKLIAQATEKNSQNKKNKTNECFSVGAEAKIFLDKTSDTVIKDRVSKGYRHPILDKKIIKQRTKREKSILEKASKIIPCPCPEQTREENLIKMPYIDGKKLSDNLENLDWSLESKWQQ